MRFQVAFSRIMWLMIAVLTVSTAGLAADNASYRLDNGMEIILKENHSSPMIASIIFVRSGSKYESTFENGITHLLEHLLFDGTTHLTREELDRSISRLGGYINAFTREDQTDFLVLLPKQFIDYGLTVQADMLFSSSFPEDELAKERQVVIEEIRQAADAPGFAAERFALEKSMAGTAYVQPVLGYEPFIANIPRQAIIDYWKRYYRPGNMTALIIGDFDTQVMKTTVAGIFGAIPDTLPPTTATPELVYELPPDPPQQHLYDTVANVQNTHIDLSFIAPPISSDDYLPMDLLVQYLAMDDVSPLYQALKSGEAPLATEVGLGLTAYDGFSRIEVSILTDRLQARQQIVRTVVDQLSGAARLTASPDILKGIKTGVKTSDIFYAEKLHYYAFIIAPYMMTGGWEFVQHYAEALDRVTWGQCRQAAEKWLARPSYVATMVRPLEIDTQTAYVPTSLTVDEVTAHFAAATLPVHDVSEGIELTYPSPDSIKMELSENAEYHREVLPNGLTLIIKSSPDSRVFAMNVLGKNRTLNEPSGMAGITDFVNHVIEKGTVTRDARDLTRDLAAIGANVTLYDNPWIPYDDRYTSRRFSFLKFETIEEYAEKGFYLFAEMLQHPSFDSAEVEKVRRSLLGSLGRDGADPRKQARDQFYATLFEGNDYGRPITGDARSIASITRDQLAEYHRRYYAPENLIITIATSRPVDQVSSWVNGIFGNQTATAGLAEVSYAGSSLSTGLKRQVDMESEQVAIYLGGPLPGANHEDAVALDLAASILSTRLYHNLREKQGLAYSVGAGTGFDRDFGWYYAVMGTGADNREKAISGIKLEIEKLKYDGPSYEELLTARNQIWGRLSSARLSRINQAYYLGVDEYLGRSLGYDSELLEKLQSVTTDDIRRVMARYFNLEAGVQVTAGPAIQ
ncbi:MAG: pitrilysin family protein [bacterium]